MLTIVLWWKMLPELMQRTCTQAAVKNVKNLQVKAGDSELILRQQTSSATDKEYEFTRNLIWINSSRRRRQWVAAPVSSDASYLCQKHVHIIYGSNEVNHPLLRSVKEMYLLAGCGMKNGRRANCQDNKAVSQELHHPPNIEGDEAFWSRFFPCNAHRRSVKK